MQRVFRAAHGQSLQRANPGTWSRRRPIRTKSVIARRRRLSSRRRPLWKSDFDNRIVTAYDPDVGFSVDRNVGEVKLWGFDASVGFTVLQGLSALWIGVV